MKYYWVIRRIVNGTEVNRALRHYESIADAMQAGHRDLSGVQKLFLYVEVITQDGIVCPTTRLPNVCG